MPVLLVTDSRGHGLRKYLQIRAPHVFVISIKSGADLDKLFSMASDKMKVTQYTAVIVMGGICLITHRDPMTHITSLHTGNCDEVTTAIRGSIKKGRKKLKKIAPNLMCVLTVRRDSATPLPSIFILRFTQNERSISVLSANI